VSTAPALFSALVFEGAQMQLHEYLASQMVRGTQRNFSRLHSDFLQEQQMSNTDGRPDVKVEQVDHRVIEGSNGAGNNFVEGESQDFSTDAFKSQPSPRGETTNDPAAGA
jgi:hypothetical protein